MKLIKSQIQALRDLPVAHVRKALTDAGFSLQPPKRPIKNAIDVAIYEGGMSYQDAQDKLAELFPEVLEVGDRVHISSFASTFEGAMAAAKRQRKVFPAFSQQAMRTARDLVAWWKALQLESIDVNPGIPRVVKEACKDRVFIDRLHRVNHGVYCNTKLRNLDLYETIRHIPHLLALSAQGRTETAPVGIFCTPHWRSNLAGIMMDDIFNPDYMAHNPDLLDRFPPSAIINTSDRLPQAFWILNKIFPEPAFYDAFVVHLNEHFFGDRKIRKMGWNTRIGGFMNQKHYMQDGSGRTPFVHVRESSSRYPMEMEAYMRQFHEQWLKDRQAAGLPIEIAKAPEPAPSRQAASPTDFARAQAKPKIVEAPAENGEAKPWDIAEGSIKMDEMYKKLRKVAVPEWVTELGKSFQKYFKDHPGPARTRSETDFEVAFMLHACGVYPGEIYSFFLDKNLLQNDDPVPRKHSDGTEFTAVRIDGEAARDRACRRVVCNSSFLPSDSHVSKNRTRYEQKDPWHIYASVMPTQDHEQVMRRLDEWDAREEARYQRQLAEAEAESPGMSM